MMKVQNQNSQAEPQSGRSGMHWITWVCCAAMLFPLVIFIANGGSFESTGALLTAIAPIGLCVGAHFLLHRLLGQSCAGHRATKNDREGLASDAGEADGDVQPRKIAQ